MKIVPVIHYKHPEPELAITNAKIAFKLGCPAICLISMDSTKDQYIPLLAKLIKQLYPDKQIGINLLSLSALESINISLEHGLDITWSDYPIVTSKILSSPDAISIKNLIEKTNHVFLSACAFKYQIHEPNPAQAAINCINHHFVPTTSGNATGEPTDLSKIKDIKNSIGYQPLAIASGLTPENALEYAKAGVDYGLVATGISEDFWTFSEEKLKLLLENIKI